MAEQPTKGEFIAAISATVVLRPGEQITELGREQIETQVKEQISSRWSVPFDEIEFVDARWDGSTWTCEKIKMPWPKIEISFSIDTRDG